MTGTRLELPLAAARSGPPAPLHGIRVVDFTRVVAGPFGTQILADLGADVIKIENPQSGDDTRTIGIGAKLGGESAFFLSLNRGKQSVAVDLKSEAGRHVVLDLIATADVLVENFTGAVMRRFQLDYPSIRDRFPALVYCSISGYGRSGPNADAAGYDSPVTAEAGALWLNRYDGQAPVLGAIPYTDLTTAMNATIGILAALRARDRDGLGQHVDVAMFDTAIANLSFKGVEFLASGKEPGVNTRAIALPRGEFATADGRIVITCAGDKMFRALCLEVIDRPHWLEDPRYASARERMRHGAAFLEDIEKIFSSEPSAVWSDRCKRAKIPCGAVRTVGEALASHEARERGQLFDVAHPSAGRIPAIGQPFTLSRTPCDPRTAPLLGEHTHAALTTLLGYDDARIEALAADGAIGLAAAVPETVGS